MTLLGAGLQQLVYQLLGHWVSMSGIILGKQHPVHVVAASLVQSSPKLLLYAADAGLGSIVTVTKRRSPPFTSWTLRDIEKMMAGDVPPTTSSKPSNQSTSPEHEYAVHEEGQTAKVYRHDDFLSSTAWLHTCCDLQGSDAEHSYENWTRSAGCAVPADLQDAVIWRYRTRRLAHALDKQSLSDTWKLDRGLHTIFRTCQELRPGREASKETAPTTFKAHQLNYAADETSYARARDIMILQADRRDTWK